MSVYTFESLDDALPWYLMPLEIKLSFLISVQILNVCVEKKLAQRLLTITTAKRKIELKKANKCYLKYLLVQF